MNEELIPLNSYVPPYGRLICYGLHDGLYCALLNEKAKQITKLPMGVSSSKCFRRAQATTLSGRMLPHPSNKGVA